QAIGKRPATPGAAGKIHINKWSAIRRIATKRNPRIAAVRSGKDPVRDHLRQRPEATIHHAEASQAARRTGSGEHGVRNRAWRGNNLNGPEDPFVIWNPCWQNGPDGTIGGRLGKRQRVVNGSFYLRRTAGPIGGHVVALLGQGDQKPDGFPDVNAVII